MLPHRPARVCRNQGPGLGQAVVDSEGTETQEREARPVLCPPSCPLRVLGCSGYMETRHGSETETHTQLLKAQEAGLWARLTAGGSDMKGGAPCHQLRLARRPAAP